MEVGNITKAASFKSFLHLSYKNTQLLFFVTVLFNIFLRQTLTDDFWGLHKNMNCAFPLKGTLSPQTKTSSNNNIPESKVSKRNPQLITFQRTIFEIYIQNKL